MSALDRPIFIDDRTEEEKVELQAAQAAYFRCFSYVDNMMSRLFPSAKVTEQHEDYAQKITMACTLEALYEDSHVGFKSACVDSIKRAKDVNEYANSDLLIDNPNQITRMTEQDFKNVGKSLTQCIRSNRNFEGLIQFATRKYFYWTEEGSSKFYAPYLVKNFTEDRNRFKSYEFKGDEDQDGLEYKLDYLTDRFARHQIKDYYVCMTSNSPAMSDKFDMADMKLNCLPERLSYHLNVHSVFCRRLYERCLRKRDNYMLSKNPNYDMNIAMQERPFNDFVECQLYDADIAKVCVSVVEEYVNRKAVTDAEAAYNEKLQEMSK